MAGVRKPRHNMLNKTRKRMCCQPAGKAQPANATAMQFLRTNSANPGAPAGNMENSLCTTHLYFNNLMVAIS
jgi:hypothetical protein